MMGFRRQRFGAEVVLGGQRADASELAAVTAQLAAAQAQIAQQGKLLAERSSLLMNANGHVSRLTATVERQTRELAQERAEVGRLNSDLADASVAHREPGADPGAAFWRREAEMLKVSAARLDSLLARAEGRAP